MDKGESFIVKLDKVSKLNKISLTLIFLLYLFIAILFTSLLYGKENYSIIPDDNYSFGGDQQVNVQTLIVTKNTLKDDSDRQLDSKYFLYSIIDVKNDRTFNNAICDYSLLTNNDRMYYFNQLGTKINGLDKTLNLPASKMRLQSTSNTSTSTVNPEYSTLLQEHGIKKIFTSINYKDEENIIKTQSTSNFINITENELKKAVEESKKTNLYSINFSITGSSTDKSYYYYKFELKIIDKKAPYQIDFQSFIETKDGSVYPLLGLYNYSDDDSNFTNIGYPSQNENYIYKNLEVEKIYVKTYFYTALEQVKNSKAAQSETLVFNLQQKIDEFER